MPRQGAKSLPAAAGEEPAPAAPAAPSDPAERASEVCEEGSNTEPAEPRSPRKDASTDPYEHSGERMVSGLTLIVLADEIYWWPDNLIKKDDLKDLLECPVCLRVPRSSPIYQCARGHVVCSECRPNVTTCPQCRDPLVGNIRSLISEKMLEKLPCVCKYTDNGCNVS